VQFFQLLEDALPEGIVKSGLIRMAEKESITLQRISSVFEYPEFRLFIRLVKCGNTAVFTHSIISSCVPCGDSTPPGWLSHLQALWEIDWLVPCWNFITLECLLPGLIPTGDCLSIACFRSRKPLRYNRVQNKIEKPLFFAPIW
jgi:hypothetical protein